MCLRYQSESVTRPRTKHGLPEVGALAPHGSGQHSWLELSLSRAKLTQ